MRITNEAMLMIVLLIALFHIWAWRKHRNNWDIALLVPLAWMTLYYLLLIKNDAATTQFRESMIRPAVVSYLLINSLATWEPELTKLWLRFLRWRKGGNPG